MLQYRKFLDLTDEEIKFIINDIFHPIKVDNIQRDGKSNIISCDIYIMEEYPEFADTLDLYINKIITHDFLITEDENFKWKQFLLAKGCNVLLKDNPYLEEKDGT